MLNLVKVKQRIMQSKLSPMPSFISKAHKINKGHHYIEMLKIRAVLLLNPEENI